MSFASSIARFSPQLALDLPAPAPTPSTPTTVLDHPNRTVFAAAARQNEFVQEFIAEGLATWSPERVERDPPFFLVFELGEVVGNLSDLTMMERHAAKQGGLGKRLGFRALRPHDEVLAYNIGVSRAPSHPRRLRYEQRMALKRLLGDDGRAVSSAKRRTQRDFVAWARAQRGLPARVADATGLTLKAFWRAVHGEGAVPR